MKELVQKIKDAYHQFTASKTRVAIALAVAVALLGALLLLPPRQSVELVAGAPTVQTMDAGVSNTSAEDASVVVDLPAPTDASEQH